jgi:hypothetical protein
LKIPDSVKIGPFTYTVKWHKKIVDNGEDCWGTIKYGAGLINLERGLPEARALTVFFHECIHGLDDLAQIGLSEKQILRLAPALTAFLVDNGLLRDD